MKIELEVGDVVRLKSGGPVMTVVKVYDDDDAECAWFGNINPAVVSNSVSSARFAKVALAGIIPVIADNKNSGVHHGVYLEVGQLPD